MITGIAIDSNPITNQTYVLITETEETVEVDGIYIFGEEVIVDEEDINIEPRSYWDEDEE